MRFDRNYQLTIGTGNRAVIIRPPLQIVFNVTKSLDKSLNKMTLQVFNLNESNRLATTKDSTKPDRMPIILQVGYNGSLQTIFQGDIESGGAKREAADFVSTFNCLDGGHDFLYAFTSRTVRDKDTAISEILKDTPYTKKGRITKQREITRPKVLVGNSLQLVQESLDDDEDWFIDNEQLYIVKKDEVVSSYIPVVSATTGLINTPERKEKTVTFQTIMNPSIKLGGRVQLVSANAPHLNDVYKVTAINYFGDYDGAVWTQDISAKVVTNVRVIK
ncbi:MAG: hypothetical protein IBX55_08875 [Methyloprofundus sp.]|nr:hypothetical protein [Methyloprofundus sp.]